MAGTKGRYAEFAYWPAYQSLYIRAFDRMLKERERRGKMEGTWNMGTAGEDVFHWWMEDGVLPGQLTIDTYQELADEDAEWR